MVKTLVILRTGVFNIWKVKRNGVIWKETEKKSLTADKDNSRILADIFHSGVPLITNASSWNEEEKNKQKSELLYDPK